MGTAYLKANCFTSCNRVEEVKERLQQQQSDICIAIRIQITYLQSNLTQQPLPADRRCRATSHSDSSENVSFQNVNQLGFNVTTWLD